MSYNFYVKSKMSPGRIVKCSKIPESGSASTTSNIYLNPYENSAPIPISGTESLQIFADSTSAADQVYVATDSPEAYNLTIQKKITESGTTWDLFINTSAKSEAPINVTVGQDEPTKRMSPIAILIAAVSYVLSVLVNEFSKPLWFAAAGFLAALLIGATIHYVIMKKKKTTLNI